MNISHIFYINLEHRVDKYAYMEKQLSVCGIKYTRIVGIIPDDYKNYHTSFSYISKDELRYKGTIGCFLSHKKTIDSVTNFDNSSQNYIMILEDDVKINQVFWSYTKQINPSPEFDFVFFNSGRILNIKNCLDVENGLWPIDSDFPNFCGAFCYAINLKKLCKIQHEMSDIKEYIDFDRFIFKNKELKSCTYQSELIKVEHTFSSDRDPNAIWNQQIDRRAWPHRLVNYD